MKTPNFYLKFAFKAQIIKALLQFSKYLPVILPIKNNQTIIRRDHFFCKSHTFNRFSDVFERYRWGQDY